MTVSEPPGWPVSDGFRRVDERPTSYCVDRRCRLKGKRHLHEPFGQPKLTPEAERYAADVAAELEYLAARDMGFC